MFKLKSNYVVCYTYKINCPFPPDIGITAPSKDRLPKITSLPTKCPFLAIYFSGDL